MNIDIQVLDKLLNKIEEVKCNKDYNLDDLDHINNIINIFNKLDQSEISIVDSLETLKILELNKYPEIWIDLYKNSNDKEQYELLKIAKKYNLQKCIKEYIHSNEFKDL